MRNAKVGQIKNCIVIPRTDFTRIFNKIFNNTNIEFKLNNSLTFYNDSLENIYAKFAKYYDVTKVQSIHATSTDIWIDYHI